MLHQNLVLHKFENGFRILPQKDLENKFFVIDDVQIEIGSEFRVGPNGYFEYIGNPSAEIAARATQDVVA
jgi:hypothetical protein